MHLNKREKSDMNREELKYYFHIKAFIFPRLSLLRVDILIHFLKLNKTLYWIFPFSLFLNGSTEENIGSANQNQVC